MKFHLYLFDEWIQGSRGWEEIATKVAYVITFLLFSPLFLVLGLVGMGIKAFHAELLLRDNREMIYRFEEDFNKNSNGSLSSGEVVEEIEMGQDDYASKVAVVERMVSLSEKYFHTLGYAFDKEMKTITIYSKE